MSVPEYMMNARHDDPLRWAAQQRPVRQLRGLRQGVLARRARQAADDPFPQAQLPCGASLMNHTAAVSSHPCKGVPPWPP
jgi:hypothetical protein